MCISLIYIVELYHNARCKKHIKAYVIVSTRFSGCNCYTEPTSQKRRIPLCPNAVCVLTICIASMNTRYPEKKRCFFFYSGY